jgi:hypothetical protein
MPKTPEAKRQYWREHHQKHRDRKNAQARQRYATKEHPRVPMSNEQRAYNRAHYQAHQEEARVRGRAYYAAHQERMSARARTYARSRLEADREAVYTYNRQRQELYKETRRIYACRWAARNYETSLTFRLRSNLRSRLYLAVRNRSKTGSAVRDLGCSIEEFIEYIASLFEPGMSWSNWGEWHLDHIKPLASFDLTDREQFLKACHYTNIRPLWANDNLRRGTYARKTALKI